LAAGSICLTLLWRRSRCRTVLAVGACGADSDTNSAAGRVGTKSLESSGWGNGSSGVDFVNPYTFVPLVRACSGGSSLSMRRWGMSGRQGHECDAASTDTPADRRYGYLRGPPRCCRNVRLSNRTKSPPSCRPAPSALSAGYSCAPESSCARRGAIAGERDHQPRHRLGVRFRQCTACWEAVGIHEQQATAGDQILYWAVL
jgi:hypothetical protein